MNHPTQDKIIAFNQKEYNHKNKMETPAIKLIRIINERPQTYQHSMYKKGWVLQVLHEYNGYVTAKVLTGVGSYTDSIMSVHPLDYQEIRVVDQPSGVPNHQ